MFIKLVSFTVLEAALLMLTITFVALILKYWCKFGNNGSDPLILASFTFLAVSSMNRCITNLVNYVLAFAYQSSNIDTSFKEWYHTYYPGFEQHCLILYSLTVGLRNISFCANLSRWFITIASL